MATALDVATYILEARGPMSAMKLQKLVYYCQAWHLVRRDTPLFNEKLQAWAAGPVVRELYDKHKGLFTVGASDIGGNSSAVTQDERVTVDRVVNHYWKLNAAQLSELTHSEPPWMEAREGLGPDERSDKAIDLSTMVAYYTGLSERARAK